MNELNARLLDYLPDPNTIKGGIGGIVEAMKEEAPLLIEEIIYYNIWKPMLVQILCVIILVLIWVVLRRKLWGFAIKHSVNSDGFSEFSIGSLMGLTSLVVIIFFCFNFSWLQPLIAPRLFLLEYISNLL